MKNIQEINRVGVGVCGSINNALLLLDLPNAENVETKKKKRESRRRSDRHEGK